MKRMVILVLALALLVACVPVNAVSAEEGECGCYDKELTFYWQTRPTCTSEGEIFGECFYCGRYEEKTVPALGHGEGVVSGRVESTCVRAGYQEISCPRCDIWFRTEELPLADHAYGDDRICDVCGKEKEHVWDAGEVLAEPTAESNGTKKYTCTDCGDTKTVTLTTAEIRDGKYYKDGKRVPYAGLVQVEDAYYYVGAKGAITTGRYMVSRVNELSYESGIYYFAEDGKMNTARGVYDGYYYGEDGRLTAYAGLVEWNGAKYYVGAAGKVHANGSYFITKVNGLLPKSGRCYFFADGRMLDDTRINHADGCYYENGMRKPYAGLVRHCGYWYYVGSNGKFWTGKYTLLNVNDSGYPVYGRVIFNTDGRMMTDVFVSSSDNCFFGQYYGPDGLRWDSKNNDPVQGKDRWGNYFEGGENAIYDLLNYTEY